MNNKEDYKKLFSLDKKVAIVTGHFPPKRGPDKPDYIRELITRTPMGE